MARSDPLQIIEAVILRARRDADGIRGVDRTAALMLALSRQCRGLAGRRLTHDRDFTFKVAVLAFHAVGEEVHPVEIYREQQQFCALIGTDGAELESLKRYLMRRLYGDDFATRPTLGNHH